MHRLPKWCRLSREPDEIIGEHEMLRWWIVPRNRWLFVALHKHQGNDPREPHDHPADNLSIRIRGDLLEYTPTPIAEIEHVLGPIHAVTHGGRHVWFGLGGVACESARLMPRVRFRRAEQAHRLELLNAAPAWTIWIRFRNRRRWGYFERTGWRPAKTARQP